MNNRSHKYDINRLILDIGTNIVNIEIVSV